MSHNVSSHLDALATFLSNTSSNVTSEAIQKMMYWTMKTFPNHGWLSFPMGVLQPSSACDIPGIVPQVRYDKVPNNNIVKYLRLLTGQVEAKFVQYWYKIV